MAVGIRPFGIRLTAFVISGMITGLAVAVFGFGALLWVKLAGEAMQPVSNRASLNAEKVKAMFA